MSDRPLDLLQDAEEAPPKRERRDAVENRERLLAVAKGLFAAQGAEQTTMQAIAHCRHPTVAMIKGACVGGGLEIAAACDMRICGESSRFGVPVKNLGLVMAYGELKGLIDVVGRAVALEIVLEGRVFGIVSTGFNIAGLMGPMFYASLLDHGFYRGIFLAATAFMLITMGITFAQELRARRA